MFQMEEEAIQCRRQMIYLHFGNFHRNSSKTGECVVPQGELRLHKECVVYPVHLHWDDAATDA